MMVNLVKVGAHYVNIDKLSYIQRVVFNSVPEQICYVFGFIEKASMTVTEEEFNEFKDRCLRMWEGMGGGICHFFD